MAAEAPPRPPRAIPLELTADPAFAPRIRRLAATSLPALGLVWLLAATRLDAPSWVGAMLLAGWATMPLLLWASLRRPALRYGLTLPAGLVGLALLAICLGALPAAPLARLGWLLLTAGIWTGGVLGVWFWFRPRWLPVPAGLDHPFAPGRWVLVGGHVGLVMVGLLLAALG